jgi:photoactive yellow protein
MKGSAVRRTALDVSTPHDEIFELDESQIDDLPFGLIAVDQQGNIQQYNSWESKMARLAKERVIGRNFFRDVAPCSAVQEFQGRFERFAQEPGDGAESFDFVFPFPFGRQYVHITFLRSAKNSQIRILVNRYDEK